MSELTKVITDAVTGEQITVALTQEEIAEIQNSYLEWQKIKRDIKQPTVSEQLEKLAKG